MVHDVANAVGPLAAIVSTMSTDGTVASRCQYLYGLVVVIGIALGLLLFGPKLIHTVGQKITRLNAPRAY